MNIKNTQYGKFVSIKHSKYELTRVWRIKENFRDILFRRLQAGTLSLFSRWKRDAKNAIIKENNEGSRYV
jgi:hypothetical protein